MAFFSLQSTPLATSSGGITNTSRCICHPCRRALFISKERVFHLLIEMTARSTHRFSLLQEGESVLTLLFSSRNPFATKHAWFSLHFFSYYPIRFYLVLAFVFYYLKCQISYFILFSLHNVVIEVL